MYLNGVERGISPFGPEELDFSEVKTYKVFAKKTIHGTEGMQIWEGRETVALGPRSKTKYDIPMTKVQFIPSQRTVVEKGELVVQPVRAYLEVIERCPNVKSVTRVTNNNKESIETSSPVLSPTKDLLVYCLYEKDERKQTKSSNIWRQKIAEFPRTRLTFGTSKDVSPSFTSDGTELVFASNRVGTGSLLWRINIDKPVGITKISNGYARDYAPSVSPIDGTIVYVSLPFSAEDQQIWAVDKDGNLPTQLREGKTPDVSPNGEKILFVRKDKESGRKQIWVMSIDGGQETQLTQNTTYDTIDPKWSPDGKYIVLASNEGLDMNKHPNYDIWLMRSDGAQKTQLTTNGSDDVGPRWDRTGRYIYFRSNRGNLWNIWRFEPAMRQTPEEAQLD